MANAVVRVLDFYGRGGGAIRQRCRLDSTIDLVSTTDTTATFKWQGTFKFKNDPTVIYDPEKPISDFFVVTTANPADYPFLPGVDYYQKDIPTPSASNLLVFRIDVTDNTPPYSNNLWILPTGRVLTNSTDAVELGQSGYVYNLDYNFTVPKTGTTIPVLYVTSSHTGLLSISDTSWESTQVFEYTFPPSVERYRPGAVYDGARFLSCNRSGGKCNIYNGTNFTEMTTEAGGANDPPLIYNGTKFVNMGKSGNE